MGDSKTTKTWLGTKPYMSPELFDGRAYNPASCDIFAAGQILYILYAGRFAFDEASLKNAYYNFLLQGKPIIFGGSMKKLSNNTQASLPLPLKN
jgi:serine/threonine protein kinase